MELGERFIKAESFTPEQLAKLTELLKAMEVHRLDVLAPRSKGVRARDGVLVGVHKLETVFDGVRYGLLVMFDIESYRKIVMYSLSAGNRSKAVFSLKTTPDHLSDRERRSLNDELRTLAVKLRALVWRGIEEDGAHNRRVWDDRLLAARVTFRSRL